jgi:hypothetical protein
MVNATALEIYYGYSVWVPGVGGYDLLKLGSALWSLSHQVYSHHFALNLDFNNTRVSAA